MFCELNGKRLLVLGGSAWIDIIKAFAKENNITLVAVGNNPESPLSRLDEYYNVDSTNHSAMKQLIVDKKIDGVYIGSNEAVIRHALEYLEELGLPVYCKLNQWDSLMNKGKFKELCKKFEIPVVPRYQYAPNEKCDIEFPVITKPADGCASVGIMICNTAEDLKRGYEFAKNNSPSGEVIVEKLVNNDGLDVFFQITNGGVDFCVLGDKYPVQLEEGAGSVAGARILPSIVTAEFSRRFNKKIESMFKSIGLYQGLIWMEVFRDGNNYYFNEVGYRPNGSLSIVGIDYLCGINTVAADMYYGLTGKGKKDGFPSLILKKAVMGKKKVCEYWIASRPGTIGEIKGVNEVLEHPNVLAAFPKYEIGSTVPHTNGFAQNFCVIHFVYDNANELEAVVKFIQEKVELKDIDNNDMIIHKDENFVKKLLEDN